MAIRYDKGLQKELRNAVANFNQKIARLEKTNRNLYLPEKVKVKGIKSEVSSRAELKRKISSLRRFTKRGAEETITTSGGVSMSRYAMQETSLELRRAKLNLTRQYNRLSNIKPRTFGIEEDATYKQMGSQHVANILARREALEVNLKKISQEELEKLESRITDTFNKLKYKKEIFMDNYMNEILFKLGYYVDYDQEKIEYIRSRLRLLDEKQFMNMFETELSIRDILDYYPESQKVNGDPSKIKDEVTELYDNLYENIDDMIKDYIR